MITNSMVGVLILLHLHVSTTSLRDGLDLPDLPVLSWSSVFCLASVFAVCSRCK